MRVHTILGIFILGILSSGCNLVGLSAHNLHFELSRGSEEIQECERNRKLADNAWSETISGSPDHPFSEDYQLGFKDGFADYLEAGGNGEPPSLPPRRYFKARYETPEGYQAIQDWYAGFRHGASVAMQSGYRRFITLPLASSPPAEGPLATGPIAGGPIILPSGPEPVIKRTEEIPVPVLPPPRKIGPAPEEVRPLPDIGAREGTSSRKVRNVHPDTVQAIAAPEKKRPPPSKTSDGVKTSNAKPSHPDPREQPKPDNPAVTLKYAE